MSRPGDALTPAYDLAAGQYHGFGHTAGSFEGWYRKTVDATGAAPLRDYSRHLSRQGTASIRNSFVQTLDGAKRATCYHRYPLAAFSAAPAAFDIRGDRTASPARGVGTSTGPNSGDDRPVGDDGITPCR